MENIIKECLNYEEIKFSENRNDLSKPFILPEKEKLLEADEVKKKKDSIEYVFILNSNKKIKLTYFNDFKIKKEIIDKEVLFTPNSLVYIKSFLNKDWSIQEAKWFNGKKKVLSISHAFYIFCLYYKFNFSFEKIMGNNLSSEEEKQVSELFKKNPDKIQEPTYHIFNDLSDVKKIHEELEKNHLSILLSNSKTIKERYFFDKEKTNKKKNFSLGFELLFKNEIKINESYGIKGCSLDFENDLNIRSLCVKYYYTNNKKRFINFNVGKNGFKENQEISTIFDTRLSGDRDGKYYSKVRFFNEFPLKIESITLPKHFGQYCDLKHTFVFDEEEKVLMAKKTKKYNLFENNLKNKNELLYYILHFLYKNKKSTYRKMSNFIINNLMVEDFKEIDDDLEMLIKMNDEVFYNIFEKSRNNINFHKEIIKNIDDLNRKKITMESFLNFMENNQKRIQVIF